MKRKLCIGLTALAVAVFAGSWLLSGDKTAKADDTVKIKGQLPAHYKQLGLAEKQIQDIYKIQATCRGKIEALQQQIADLKAAEHQDVENVLTNDQKIALAKLLVGDLPEKDKPAPATDKPAPTTDKDKPAPATDKDKPAVTTDKDKPAPPKDK